MSRDKIMGKFYAWALILPLKKRYRQISAVFLAPQLLTIDIKNVNSSDSLRAQKGTQKHNEYLPKFGR